MSILRTVNFVREDDARPCPEKNYTRRSVSSYAAGQLAVNIRLRVSGISPRTTQEDISYIFSRQGQPISVVRADDYNEPVGFVEYLTQSEADIAISAINVKPPLYWQVSYTTRQNEDVLFEQCIKKQLMESELDEHCLIYDPLGDERIIDPRSSNNLIAHSSRAGNGEAKHEIYPPCAVCNSEACLACTVCKTRYCSQTCQNMDWPQHKLNCTPPPLLQIAEPLPAAYPLSNSDLPSRAPRVNPNLSNLRVNSLTQTNRFQIPCTTAVGRHSRSSESNPLSNDIVPNVNSNPRTAIGLRQYESSLVHPRASTGHGIVKVSVTEVESTSVQNKTMGNLSNGDSLRNEPVGSNKLSFSAQPSLAHQTNETGAENVTQGDRNKQDDSTIAGNTSSEVLPQMKGPDSFVAAPSKKIYATTYLSKSPTSSSISTSGPINVVVCFSKSPDKFYFQLESVQPQLQQLQSKIQEAARTADKLLEPSVGCPCLAIFDGVWYRGEVIQYHGTDDVGIRFVDYGNTAKIANTIDLIRRLELELSLHPFYAVAAKLADVSPPENGLWSEQEKNGFKHLTDYRAFSLLRVRYEDGVLCVRLRQPKAGGVDLAEYLIKKNLAKDCGRKLEFSDELDRVVPANTSSTTADPSSRPITILPYTGAIPKKPFVEPARPIPAPAQLENRKSSESTLPVAEPFVRLPSTSVNGILKSAPIVITSPPPPFKVVLTAPPAQSSVPFPAPAAHSPPLAASSVPVLSPLSVSSIPLPSPILVSSIPLPPSASPVPVPSLAAPVPVPSSVAPVAPVTYQTPKSNSILDELVEKSSVQFSVTVGFDSGCCIGSLITQSDDLAFLEFNSYALSLEAAADFRPSVGSVVAALSPEHDEWFRACIVAVDQNAYSVVYVDFGNSEDGIVSVKPVPESYQLKEMAVKLSVIGVDTSTIQLLPDTTHALEVISKEDDFIMAKFEDETVSAERIKLESWTSLVKQLVPCPVQRTIEGRRCDPGFTGEVVPVVIEDLDHIYVFFDEDLLLTVEIQTQMRTKSSSCSVLTSPPAVGSIVMALFAEDGDYYRAKVVNVDGASICVHYIDFGNSATVALEELKTLPEDMFQYPACATRVALGQVPLPAGGLPENVKTRLEDCINQRYTIVVLPSPDPSVMQCILSIEGQVLNDTILELIESNQQCSNDQEDQETAAAAAAAAAAAQISESMSKVVIENPIVPEEVALVGDVCVPQQMHQLFTKAFSEGQVAVDGTLGRFFWNQGVFLDLPEGEEFQAVILSSDHPQCLVLCAADEAVFMKLDQLQEEMCSYSEEILTGHTPVCNEVCIIKSPVDGLWYRAAMLSAQGSEFAFILVDYGQLLSVAVGDIRRIPKRFVDSVPYIAQPAMLNEVRHVLELDDQLGARISALLPENSFVPLRVVSRNGRVYAVDIPSVSKILLEEGLLWKGLE